MTKAISKAAVLIVTILLTGCQTAPQKNTTNTPEVLNNNAINTEAPPIEQNASYTIFYDQGDHLKELIAANNYNTALNLINDHYDFFISSSKITGKKRLEQYAKELEQVAEYLNHTLYSNKIRSDISSLSAFNTFPPPYSQWEEINRAIIDAQNHIADYRTNSITKIDSYFLADITHLETKITDLTKQLHASGKDAFASYITTQEDDFFNQYPTKLDSLNIISSSSLEISEYLTKGDTDRIVNFMELYGHNIPASQKKKIGSIFISKHHQENRDNSKHELAIVMDGAVKAAELGIATDQLNKMKISFVEVTSKTLLNEGQIEFPATIEMDLPFNISKAEIGDIFSDTKDSDYIIVFDVALASVNRRVKKREQENSKYLAGINRVSNAAYTAKQMEIQGIQMQIQRTLNQPCYGSSPLACSIGNAIAAGFHKPALETAQQELLITPQMLDEPIHKNYKYSHSMMDVRRNMTANYYVINNKKKTYFKDTFDITESRKFNLAYDVKEEDIAHSDLLKKYDSEEAISKYEDSTMSLKVTQLLKHYVENAGEEVNLKDENEFRAAIMYDKNEALVAYKEHIYDARPLNDHRFDHVVVIYNPAGSVGSGFYVAPDLVITNYHVIDGSKYVEMKLYNGHETFGKVVKSDVRLDLALLKVQEKGKPVQFYKNNSLDLGGTTEAIGHPKGLEFTVTRGVISAVRNKESIFDTGGKEVLFVQTDTAINPGNSGGPLFLGDYVIGINDNKLVDIGTEGLGFAIHHSEVEKFLDEDF